MTGNLETIQKETQSKPRQVGIIFSHMQSSVCKLVTHGPGQPTDIFGSQCVFEIFSQLPTFEIGEILLYFIFKIFFFDVDRF